MPEDQKVEEKTDSSETSDEKVEAKEKKATTKKTSMPAAKKSQLLGKDELIDAIKQMTVVELADLVKALETELGVSAAAPVAVAAATAPAAEEAAPAEEQAEFAVILTSFGESKINVIKAMRSVTTLGLKEAKELVESAPKPIKEGVTKEEATAVKEKLEAAGATVEVK